MTYKLVHEPKGKTYEYATEDDVAQRLRSIANDPRYNIERRDEHTFVVSAKPTEPEPE